MTGLIVIAAVIAGYAIGTIDCLLTVRSVLTDHFND